MITKTRERKIKLLEHNLEDVAQISGKHNLSILNAKILSARGFKNDDTLDKYLRPSLRDGLIDPRKLVGLQAACDLIDETVTKGEAIAIACDFDVDGLSSSAQVYAFLKSINAKVKIFVPDRFNEGYGLNERIIKEAKEFGATLLICLDFGTHNKKELESARATGLKTIVVDHHIVDGENPPCDVFINPQQPGCGFADKILCTAGLAWYLTLGLKNSIKRADKFDVKYALDLACLGTVCDMVPLLGINRIIAKRGLEVLTNSERAGIVSLKEVSGIKADVSCYDVSFLLGPRINAAGRMISGEMVAELLTTEDKIRAQKLATKLHRINFQRQEEEAKVKKDAISQVEKEEELPYGIVVWKEDYHTGVVGIVAQRLVEKFYRPSVVLGKDKDRIYKGSVRGIKGVNVVEALAESKEYLIKYGGHESAGGLSILEENLPQFLKDFNETCNKILTRENGEHLTPTLVCDAEADLSEVTIRAVAEMKTLAPFGMGNPNPTVLAKNLKIVETRVLKGEHLKIEFTSGKERLSGIWWKNSGHPKVSIGNSVDVAFKPDINSYNGATTVQANIQAVL